MKKTNKEFKDTNKKQKIEDAIEAIKKVMNKKVYFVVAGSIEKGKIDTWSSMKDIDPDILSRIFQGYLDKLEKESKKWEGGN